MARDVHSAAVAAVNMAQVLRAGRAGIPRDLGRSGLTLVNLLRLELSKPGTGRIYKRGKGRTHQASAPGEPPAPDYGSLRASYGHDVRHTAGSPELILGTGNRYAAALEFGTSHIKPRPHVRPVVARHAAKTVRGEVADGVEGRERAQARRLGGKG